MAGMKLWGVVMLVLLLGCVLACVSTARASKESSFPKKTSAMFLLLLPNMNMNMNMKVKINTNTNTNKKARRIEEELPNISTGPPMWNEIDAAGGRLGPTMKNESEIVAVSGWCEKQGQQHEITGACGHEHGHEEAECERATPAMACLINKTKQAISFLYKESGGAGGGGGDGREVCPPSCFRPNPVCGKDGVTYWCGLADAECAGVEVDHLGFCDFGSRGTGSRGVLAVQSLLLVHMIWLMLAAGLVLLGFP